MLERVYSVIRVAISLFRCRRDSASRLPYRANYVYAVQEQEYSLAVTLYESLKGFDTFSLKHKMWTKYFLKPVDTMLK